MSGQPVKTQADVNKFRKEYMETLALQEQINDMNLQANKTYLLSGQLPPQSQMQDTRTNAEKLADVEKLKQKIASDLSPVAEPAFAYDIVNKVLNSPLNVDNGMFRFLAQRASSIVEQLKKILPYGIRGDANDLEQIVEFIRNMYAEQNSKFKTTKSFFNSQGGESRSGIISANDIDSIIMAINDLHKNIEMIKVRIPVVLSPSIIQKIQTLTDVLSLLKRVLPTTNQVRLMIQDIENPNLQVQYPEIGQPLMNIPNFSSVEMSSFFKLIEKLPKYSIFMSLIDKCNKFINLQDWVSVDRSLDGLIGELNVMLLPENRPIINSWMNIKNRQTFKEDQAQKIQETQTREFIRAQGERQKDASKATKVYVVNPQDDPVFIAQGAITGLNQQAEAPVIAPIGTQTRTRVQEEAEASVPIQRDLKQNLGIIIGQLRDYTHKYYSEGVNEEDIKNIASIIHTASILLNNDFTDGQDVWHMDINDIMGIARRIIYEYEDMVDNSHNSIDRVNEGEGLKLKRRRRGRPRGSGLVKVPPPPKPPNFVGFGVNEINRKNLEKGILTVRRNTKTNYMDMPSKHISKNLQGVIKTIIGGGVPKYEDLGRLEEDEKEYLHKLVSRSNMSDRLSVPAPSKDQQEKDIHNFEVMKGQIMSGNDSVELVKKFKLLVRKLSKQGLLPRAEVDDIIDTLTDLNY